MLVWASPLPGSVKFRRERGMERHGRCSERPNLQKHSVICPAQETVMNNVSEGRIINVRCVAFLRAITSMPLRIYFGERKDEETTAD